MNAANLHGFAQCERVTQELRNALVSLGVPGKSILVDRWIQFSNGRRMDADLLVIGDNGSQIVAQFEVKTGMDAFGRACLTLRDLPRLHPCCVVTVDPHGEILVSAISKLRVPEWIPISDAKLMRELLEGLYEESDAAIEATKKRTMVASALESARLYVGIGGLVAILLLGALEFFGHEFSWQFYSLVFVLLALFAAMSGYVIHLKVGDNEITIGRLQSNQDLSSESKRAGLALKKGDVV